MSDNSTHDTYFVQNCFGKIYDSLKSHGIKFMKIGHGQMDAQVNSNFHNHYFSCVVFIRKPTLNIVGISLRLVMEKENMTVQGHA